MKRETAAKRLDIRAPRRADGGNSGDGAGQRTTADQIGDERQRSDHGQGNTGKAGYRITVGHAGHALLVATAKQDAVLRARGDEQHGRGAGRVKRREIEDSRVRPNRPEAVFGVVGATIRGTVTVQQEVRC